MRAWVYYPIDNTTKTDVFDAEKVTVQIFPDKRGVVTLYDGDGKFISEKLYARVHTIERRA